MKISKHKKIIEKLLKESYACRDNDNLLIAEIWQIETNNNIDFKPFLDKLKIGYFSSPESIRRCRQKLQEHNPDLRGVKYKQRKNESKNVVLELKQEFL